MAMNSVMDRPRVQPQAPNHYQNRSGNRRGNQAPRNWRARALALGAAAVAAIGIAGGAVAYSHSGSHKGTAIERVVDAPTPDAQLWQYHQAHPGELQWKPVNAKQTAAANKAFDKAAVTIDNTPALASQLGGEKLPTTGDKYVFAADGPTGIPGAYFSNLGQKLENVAASHPNMVGQWHDKTPTIDKYVDGSVILPGANPLQEKYEPVGSAASELFQYDRTTESFKPVSAAQAEEANSAFDADVVGLNHVGFDDSGHDFPANGQYVVPGGPNGSASLTELGIRALGAEFNYFGATGQVLPGDMPNYVPGTVVGK